MASRRRGKGRRKVGAQEAPDAQQNQTPQEIRSRDRATDRSLDRPSPLPFRLIPIRASHSSTSQARFTRSG